MSLPRIPHSINQCRNEISNVVFVEFGLLNTACFIVVFQRIAKPQEIRNIFSGNICLYVHNRHVRKTMCYLPLTEHYLLAVFVTTCNMCIALPLSANLNTCTKQRSLDCVSLKKSVFLLYLNQGKTYFNYADKLT